MLLFFDMTVSEHMISKTENPRTALSTLLSEWSFFPMTDVIYLDILSDPFFLYHEHMLGYGLAF